MKVSKKMSAVIMVLCLMAAFCMGLAFAAEGETNSLSGVEAAVTSGLQSTANSAMSMIQSILPVALTVVGAILVVTIGIRVFKKVTGR